MSRTAAIVVGVLRHQRTEPVRSLLSVSLEPRLHDHFAVVHRPDAVLSQPVQSVIEMAVDRMREVCAS